MGKVTVTVHELSSTNMRVSVDGKDTVLSPTQSRDFEGSSITISDEKVETDRDVSNPNYNQRDVFDHGNPNGIVRAEIGPKLAKAAGETKQEVTEDGRVLEVEVAKDQSLATAAGGPEGAEEGKTPGPKPEAVIERTASGTRPTGAESSPVKTNDSKAGSSTSAKK